MIDFQRNAVLAVAVALSACGNVDAAHLVFGQQHKVGLSISASTTTQGGDLTLGYSDRNLAVIPVALKQNDGTYAPIKGMFSNAVQGDGSRKQGNSNDAMSVLGQFELRTGANGTASVGLGKFFATGNAANVLAQGFREEMRKQKSK